MYRTRQTSYQDVEVRVTRLNYKDNLQKYFLDYYEDMIIKDNDNPNFVLGITKPSWYSGFDIRETLRIR